MKLIKKSTLFSEYRAFEFEPDDINKMFGQWPTHMVTAFLAMVGKEFKIRFFREGKK